ncbi:unnamed protein product, partial [Symbiodinium sp. KB8]
VKNNLRDLKKILPDPSKDPIEVTRQYNWERADQMLAVVVAEERNVRKWLHRFLGEHGTEEAARPVVQEIDDVLLEWVTDGVQLRYVQGILKRRAQRSRDDSPLEYGFEWTVEKLVSNSQRESFSNAHSPYGPAAAASYEYIDMTNKFLDQLRHWKSLFVPEIGFLPVAKPTIETMEKAFEAFLPFRKVLLEDMKADLPQAYVDAGGPKQNGDGETYPEITAAIPVRSLNFSYSEEYLNALRAVNTMSAAVNFTFLSAARDYYAIPTERDDIIEWLTKRIVGYPSEPKKMKDEVWGDMKTKEQKKFKTYFQKLRERLDALRQVREKEPTWIELKANVPQEGKSEDGGAVISHVDDVEQVASLVPVVEKAIADAYAKWDKELDRLVTSASKEAAVAALEDQVKAIGTQGLSQANGGYYPSFLLGLGGYVDVFTALERLKKEATRLTESINKEVTDDSVASDLKQRLAAASQQTLESAIAIGIKSASPSTLREESEVHMDAVKLVKTKFGAEAGEKVRNAAEAEKARIVEEWQRRKREEEERARKLAAEKREKAMNLAKRYKEPFQGEAKLEASSGVWHYTGKGDPEQPDALRCVSGEHAGLQLRFSTNVREPSLDIEFEKSGDGNGWGALSPSGTFSWYFDRWSPLYRFKVAATADEFTCEGNGSTWTIDQQGNGREASSHQVITVTSGVASPIITLAIGTIDAFQKAAREIRERRLAEKVAYEKKMKRLVTPTGSGGGSRVPPPAMLRGKIQIVDHFPDVTVQVVDHFPDIKVQVVDHFPDAEGKWEIVDHFPDWKVQIVSHFPDYKIQYVDHFPGVC